MPFLPALVKPALLACLTQWVWGKTPPKPVLSLKSGAVEMTQLSKQFEFDP